MSLRNIKMVLNFYHVIHLGLSTDPNPLFVSTQVLNAYRPKAKSKRCIRSKKLFLFFYKLEALFFIHICQLHKNITVFKCDVLAIALLRIENSTSFLSLPQDLDKNQNFDKQVNSNVNKEFLPKKILPRILIKFQQKYDQEFCGYLILEKFINFIRIPQLTNILTGIWVILLKFHKNSVVI